ncbi:MAG TPA: lamin tail domain-containing protein [Candidatus Saccharimonadales bacterium]
MFITEFQTNGGSASEEYIELYNATDTDIDFSDSADTTGSQWKIQFYNSTAVKTGLPNWNTAITASNSITLSGVIAAHDYYLISSTDYEPNNVQPDQVYDPSSSHLMTDTGGGLQLLSMTPTATAIDTVAHDRIMWLDPASNPVMPWNVMSKPGTGKSQQRIPNDDDEYTTIDNNLTSFMIKDDLTPLAAWVPPILVIVTPTPEPPSSGETTVDDTDNPDDNPIDPPVDEGGTTLPLQPANETAETTTILAPLITEILPNPASPLTDSADEFIELYNSNRTDFDLRGYSIEVGTTTLRSFTFTDATIVPAQSYRAFYARDTRLSLTNSGSQVRLRDPSKSIASQATAYSAASDNMAWALSGGIWQWTASATPGAVNVITAESTSKAADAKATAATTKQSTKAATAKKSTAKTSTPKIKGTSATKKAKAPKKTEKTKKANTATFSATSDVKPKPPIHPGILVAVAACAVLYGLYEYRHDISNKIAQFRANRKSGRSDRSQTAWRRGYSTE